MKTIKFYCVIGYKFNPDGDDVIDLVARFSSVSRCNLFLENNSDWLIKNYTYYQIIESETVRFGLMSDYCI